jgi:hypothetical protein
MNGYSRPASVANSMYGGIPERKMSYKLRGLSRNPTSAGTSRDLNIRKWDGGARRSTEWDGLRRVSTFIFDHQNAFILIPIRIQNYGTRKEIALFIFMDEVNREEDQHLEFLLKL